MAQYYQAQNKQGGYTKQMAQHLLSVYDNSSDNTVRATLDEMMGNQDMLDELRQTAGY